MSFSIQHFQTCNGIAFWNHMSGLVVTCGYHTRTGPCKTGSHNKRKVRNSWPNILNVSFHLKSQRCKMIGTQAVDELARLVWLCESNRLPNTEVVAPTSTCGFVSHSKRANKAIQKQKSWQETCLGDKGDSDKLAAVHQFWKPATLLLRSKNLYIHSLSFSAKIQPT